MQERVKRLYEIAQKECEAIGIPIEKDAVIEISSRMTSTFGRCSRKKSDGSKCVIKINSLLEKFSDKEIKDVIIHELLHTCAGCMNHGKKWLAYAKKINDVYGYKISQYASEEATKSYIELKKDTSKYKIECPQCKTLFLRDRKSMLVKHPEWYQCINNCNATLRRIQ